MSQHSEPPDATHLTVEANGMTFAALSWGAPEAPLALCLHGYPDTAWTWRHLGPYLAERGWRVVAPFTRGYAPTDLAPDDDYSVGAQARDAVALADALGEAGAFGGPDAPGGAGASGEAGAHGEPGRAVLIGHDWGAIAAHHVTAIAPERFRRVVTLAVPPPKALLDLLRSPDDGRLAARQLRLSSYIALNQLPLLGEGAQDWLIPTLWRRWSPGYDPGAELPRVFSALAGPGRRRAVVRYYRGLLPGAGFQDAFAVTGAQPVLFAYGAADGCVDAAVSARGAGLLAAGSRAECVAGAGHFLHLERPEAVGELVAEWLGQG